MTTEPTRTEEELAGMVAELTASNTYLRALLRSALRDLRTCGEHPPSLLLAIQHATDMRRKENRHPLEVGE